MRVPVIRIRDKDTGSLRMVGTDRHDFLEIDPETGGIHYVNLQCLESTRKYDGESTIEFVGVEISDEGVFIDFVSFEEFINLCREEERKARSVSESELKSIIDQMMD